MLRRAVYGWCTARGLSCRGRAPLFPVTFVLSAESRKSFESRRCQTIARTCASRRLRSAPRPKAARGSGLRHLSPGFSERPLLHEAASCRTAVTLTIGLTATCVSLPHIFTSSYLAAIVQVKLMNRHGTAVISDIRYVQCNTCLRHVENKPYYGALYLGHNAACPELARWGCQTSHRRRWQRQHLKPRRN